MTQTEALLDLPAEKMRHAQATHAQVIATGAQIHSTNQRVMQVIELLDHALVS